MRPERLWRFKNRRSGYEKVTKLWLYPEINCTSMLDDYYDEPGYVQLDLYQLYIQRNYPEEWAADAIPILWSLSPIAEYAPFCMRKGDAAWISPFEPGWERWRTPVFWGGDSRELEWPEDAETGERLDWFQLPVRNDRFPEFAKALAWTPSPFQETCPLRSIISSKHGRFRRESDKDFCEQSMYPLELTKRPGTPYIYEGRVYP